MNQYFRYSLRQVLRNFWVLVFAVLLLFFLGDLTENINEWMEPEGGLVFKIAFYVLDAADILLRIGPFMMALAALFAWARMASHHELTAIEAAGYPPRTHLHAPLLVALLVVCAQGWYGLSGVQDTSSLRARIERVRDGKILSESDKQLLTVTPGRVIALSEDQSLRTDIILDSDGRPIKIYQSKTAKASAATTTETTTNPVLRYDVAANTLTQTTEPMQRQPVRNHRLAIEVQSPIEAGGRAAMGLILLLVAFASLTRHGRSTGAASHAIRGVFAVTFAWLGFEVMMYALPTDWPPVAPIVYPILILLWLRMRPRH